ncbi:MAG: enoyl-CoA hydratase/isomerase family protein [Bacteriovoracaceae bacterium]
MTNNFETIVLDTTGDVGVLTINRPAKLNALNIQVHRELKDALTGLQRSSFKGLILTGEGEKAFIAGADIAEMKPMTNGEAKAFSELGQINTIMMESLPFPTIAAVNGFALGGGFEMAMSCDFIFATNNAVFGLPEVKLGLIPGFGGTQRLARVVGERRAKELMLSGRNVTAEEAKKLGIALELFDNKAALMEGCQNWFKLALGNSPAAIARAKATIGKGYEIEAIEFGNIFQTPQMIEGTSAFLEKRKANFTGK